MVFTGFNRHNMLFLGNHCRDYARETAAAMNPELSDTLISKIIMSHIPAIVRMQTSEKFPSNGLLEVGFSSHFYRNGNRVRVKSIIPVRGIEKVVTPFDVLLLYPQLRHTNIRSALEELVLSEVIPSHDIGLYGSCALEILTSLPYVNISSESDIDVCVRLPCKSSFECGVYKMFFETAKEISQKYNVRFDIEATLPDGAGVKLAELLSEQKTILCKGLYGVELRVK